MKTDAISALAGTSCTHSVSAGEGVFERFVLTLKKPLGGSVLMLVITERMHAKLVRYAALMDVVVAVWRVRKLHQVQYFTYTMYKN